MYIGRCEKNMINVFFCMQKEIIRKVKSQKIRKDFDYLTHAQIIEKIAEMQVRFVVVLDAERPFNRPFYTSVSTPSLVRPTCRRKSRICIC